MSHSLNSFQGGLYRGLLRTTIWVTKGDTRSLDDSLYGQEFTTLL